MSSCGVRNLVVSVEYPSDFTSLDVLVADVFGLRASCSVGAEYVLGSQMCSWTSL